MAATPYYTTQDLLNSIKRKIAIPISQNLFVDADLIAFLNEEMEVSQTPSILEFHEEYLVYTNFIPFKSGLQRYPIPDRAIGMKLRDVKWQDVNQNMFDMVKVSPEDKAYYQRNVGASETLYRYYLEGNDIVLLPTLNSVDAIFLVVSYFIRPNQLTFNNRASTIQSFQSQITVLSSFVNPGDTVTIVAQPTVNPFGDGQYYNAQFINPIFVNNQNIANLGQVQAPVGGYQNPFISTQNANVQIFTATNGTPMVSVSATNPGVVTTSSPHGLATGDKVTIFGNTTATPNINNTYSIIVLSPTTFSIPVNVTVPGTDGKYFNTNNEFLIGVSDIQTATNLVTTINTNGVTTATNGTPASSLIKINFENLASSQQVSVSNTNGFVMNSNTQFIQFDQVPTTWQDPVTLEVTPLFQNSAYIDFLQTGAGNRIYNFDIKIPSGGISSNVIGFNIGDVPWNIQVGDYICLANECIIPAIPSDLHSGLAERTGARILAALGDAQGLQMSQAKIAEIEKSQITMLDNRVESSPLKITTRKTILAYQGQAFRRRRL